MSRKLIALNITIILLLILTTSFALAQRVDSDGDGVLDDFDKCPNTAPRDKLPIIQRNPEYLGCSCNQIFSLLDSAYCKEVYCMAERPLEIRDRFFSARPNPCPPPKCEDSTLISYTVGPISCRGGVEVEYTCEEVITENSDVCMNKTNNLAQNQTILPQDMYDLLTKSYYENSKFTQILQMRNKESLIKSNNEVLKRINVERTVELKNRTVNNRTILVADIFLNIELDNYYSVDDFIFIEQIKGDMSDKSLIINDELFYDETNQIIVWKLNSLKEDTTLSYRITPGNNLDFEYIVQGETNSLVLKEIILPLTLLIILMVVISYWILNQKEKNKIFKN